MTEENKTLKSLIRFHSANKIDNYNRVGERGKERKTKIQKNLQNKSKHKNNKCFAWVSAISVLSLPGSHSPPHLPRIPSNTVLVSRPAAGAAQILIWSYSCVFLPSMSRTIRTSAFSFWEFSMTFYIFCRHRVCLVDRVDLICSLYSWWEVFQSSSLDTLPLGFSCGFISISACGLSTGVCSWGCPGGFRSAPVRARCGEGAAAWVGGFLAAPSTQGNWWVGQQENFCFIDYAKAFDCVDHHKV